MAQIESYLLRFFHTFNNMSNSEFKLFNGNTIKYKVDSDLNVWYQGEILCTLTYQIKSKGTKYFLKNEQGETLFTDNNRQTVGKYAILNHIVSQHG